MGTVLLIRLRRRGISLFDHFIHDLSTDLYPEDHFTRRLGDLKTDTKHDFQPNPGLEIRSSPIWR